MTPSPEQARQALRMTLPPEQIRQAPSHPRRKLPPYGRKLLNLRPRPGDELRLYFGTAEDVWNHARIRNIYAPPALILPPGANAQKFNWPVTDWQVLAIQLGSFPIDDIPNVVRLLLESGATIVRVLYGENPDLAIFRPVYKEAA